MPVMQCANGHTTTDVAAVRCPECREFVQQRVAASPRWTIGGGDPGDAAFTLVGFGLLFMVTGALGLAVLDAGVVEVLVSLVLMSMGATAWLVGCIALGVRLGGRRD